MEGYANFIGAILATAVVIGVVGVFVFTGMVVYQAIKDKKE